MLSEHVKRVHSCVRFTIDKDAWPLEQPADFTPVVLIHYDSNSTLKHNSKTVQALHSEEGIWVMYSASKEGLWLEQVNQEPMRKILETSKVTKEISDILVPLENCLVPLENCCSHKTILIKGSPGIGKSVLLAEIAFRWSKSQLLTKYILVFLLCLRDPVLQEITSLKELISYVCRGSLSDTDIDAIAKYLFKTSGKGLVFLLDGYDELPEQHNRFTVDIITRQILPHCGIIVSSRPHASRYLRQFATLRVEILGFTEEEQEQFIKHALKGDSCKIAELNDYLNNHLTIRNLCVIPFNLSVLLSLYKHEENLPETSTAMYDYFICLIICWNLKKQGIIIDQVIKNVISLPDTYCNIVNQLGRLSLEALDKHQLVFTSNEITRVCPEIETLPNAVNCFGLLHVVEHFNVSHATKTYHFLHSSIQEFLAAKYVTNLSLLEENTLLKDKFWDERYSNMFIFYVAITEGQRHSFKKFLCGANNKLGTIDSKFLNNPLKAIRLFRCFKEANDDRMCSMIEKAFTSRKILLGGQVLDTNDLYSVTVLLTQSSIKIWEQLDLFLSHVQHHGIRILHQVLANSNIIIKEIIITKNGLGASSDKLTSAIVINCKVQKLWASYNDFVGETEHFSSILSHPQSQLKMLYIRFNKLSSGAAMLIFNALRKSNNQLKQLEISSNNITDDVCETLAIMIKDNKCLQRLEMYKNPIKYHKRSIPLLLNALQHNVTLTVLGLPTYPDHIQNEILSHQKEINQKRKALNSIASLQINFG